MDQVRIFALGGLDENGKNMYVVEVNEAIFIIEAGNASISLRKAMLSFFPASKKATTLLGIGELKVQGRSLSASCR